TLLYTPRTCRQATVTTSAPPHTATCCGLSLPASPTKRAPLEKRQQLRRILAPAHWRFHAGIRLGYRHLLTLARSTWAGAQVVVDDGEIRRIRQAVVVKDEGAGLVPRFMDSGVLGDVCLIDDAIAIAVSRAILLRGEDGFQGELELVVVALLFVIQRMRALEQIVHGTVEPRHGHVLVDAI